MASSNQDETRYVVQYSGQPDAAGMLNAAVTWLYDNDFSIVDISASTGGSIFSTYLTCHREKSLNSDKRYNSESDRVLLEENIRRILHDEVKVPGGKEALRVTVNIFEDDDNSNEIIPDIDIYVKFHGYSDIIGLIATLTEYLKINFTIDNLFSRRPNQDEREQYLQISPLKEPKEHEHHGIYDEKETDEMKRYKSGMKNANTDISNKIKELLSSENNDKYETFIKGLTSTSGLGDGWDDGGPIRTLFKGAYYYSVERAKKKGVRDTDPVNPDKLTVEVVVLTKSAFPRNA